MVITRKGKVMKIGIVGGIGPEATVDYYRGIIAAYRRLKNDGSYPGIIIDSIDLQEMISYIGAGDWQRLVKMLTASLKSLAAAGADFAVIASNTPHVVFEEVRDLSPLPLISIVEETCKKAWALQYKKVGLLGTGFTMQGAFYPDCFAARGMEIFVPHSEEQRFIHEKIYDELVFGVVRSKTREKFLAIIERMVREQQVEALILGCTELPLMIKDGESPTPLLNTVEIHVDSIVALLMGKA